MGVGVGSGVGVSGIRFAPPWPYCAPKGAKIAGVGVMVGSGVGVGMGVGVPGSGVGSSSAGSILGIMEFMLMHRRTTSTTAAPARITRMAGLSSERVYRLRLRREFRFMLPPWL